jgi:hypothetical protein
VLKGMGFSAYIYPAISKGFARLRKNPLVRRVRASQAAEKLWIRVKSAESIPQGLKPTVLSSFMYGLKPVPFSTYFHSFGWAARPILTPVETTKVRAELRGGLDA